MTDKTVSVPQLELLRAIQKFLIGYELSEPLGGHKAWNEGITTACAQMFNPQENGKLLAAIKAYSDRVSVPTESRRPNRICSNCGVELFANYQEAGWNHCTREMKPFGNGCKFDGLFACAGKCQCPANTEMLGEFAAYSPLLPVPRQIQVQCEMCDGTGRMHVTRDMAIDAGNLNLSGQLISCGTCGGDGFQIEQAEPNENEKLASLPVGCQPLISECLLNSAEKLIKLSDEISEIEQHQDKHDRQEFGVKGIWRCSEHPNVASFITEHDPEIAWIDKALEGGNE